MMTDSNTSKLFIPLYLTVSGNVSESLAYIKNRIEKKASTNSQILCGNCAFPQNFHTR